MAYEKKLDSMEVYEQIKDFHEKYNQVPNVGFLAGLFKTSKMLIYDKLDTLEKAGYVKRIVKVKYKTDYKIIK